MSVTIFHSFHLKIEDILTDDNKGECVICLEDLLKGHVIARLPCLCVYHKRYVKLTRLFLKWIQLSSFVITTYSVTH